MEFIKTFAEIFAFLGAGIFFTYRAIAGYFTYNLILSLKTKRIPHQINENLDYLVITVSLEKGDSGTIAIHEAQVRVSHDANESPKIISLTGIDRLSYTNHKKRGKDWKRLDWECIESLDPFLGLAPGEKTEFSCFVEIPKSQICTIEVTILGRGLITRMLQWRASGISTPAMSQSEQVAS